MEKITFNGKDAISIDDIAGAKSDELPGTFKKGDILVFETVYEDNMVSSSWRRGTEADTPKLFILGKDRKMVSCYKLIEDQTGVHMVLEPAVDPLETAKDNAW